MSREAIVRDIHSEVESLIRLHRMGLYHTDGYKERKQRILDVIRENEIDVGRELDPVSRILFRRYME